MSRFIFMLFALACLVLLFSLKNVSGDDYKNITVVIDPGHGGFDGGAVGPDGTKEKEISLKISLLLREKLENVGINVIMTRDRDMDYAEIGSRHKKRDDILKRLEIIKKSNCDILISFHLNSIPSSRWRGSQVFYTKRNPDNKILAKHIQDNLVQILKNTHRKEIPINNIFLLRNVDCVTALVEGGFLSNSEELQLLKDENYQDKVAISIFYGIITYLDEKQGNVEYN